MKEGSKQYYCLSPNSLCGCYSVTFSYSCRGDSYHEDGAFYWAPSMKWCGFAITQSVCMRMCVCSCVCVHACVTRLWVSLVSVTLSS